MILKGNQRGGGKQLAAHLLKVEDNEHVHIHELRGFMSDNLHSALHEAYAETIPVFLEPQSAAKRESPGRGI